MLTSLYLRNFIIVREAELALGKGMTAITGETGAGKSILIDALTLVLGGRTSSDIIRQGEDQAEIIASFDLAACTEAMSWLKDQELDAEQDCVIRRILRRNGPSRGFINGRPVAMQQLRQLGDFLVDIHGQHEHQSLLRPDDQRDMLDSRPQFEEAAVGGFFVTIGDHLGAPGQRLGVAGDHRLAGGEGVVLGEKGGEGGAAESAGSGGEEFAARLLQGVSGKVHLEGVISNQ